jgi:hypothetical protein
MRSYDLRRGDNRLKRMNESGSAKWPTARVTHTPQHDGDILREQERSNSAKCCFPEVPDALRDSFFSEIATRLKFLRHITETDVRHTSAAMLVGLLEESKQQRAG